MSRSSNTEVSAPLSSEREIDGKGGKVGTNAHNKSSC